MLEKLSFMSYAREKNVGHFEIFHSPPTSPHLLPLRSLFPLSGLFLISGSPFSCISGKVLESCLPLL